MKWNIIFATLLFAFNSPSYSDTLVSLETRNIAEQPFWLIETENAVASVILFAGGHGNIDVDDDGINKLKNNFLVRSRDSFSEYGLNVAVVDAPTDRNKLFNFRTTEKHATDIKLVIKYLRDKYKKPVWLIGTSRGTTSVANVAARLEQASGPDGVVFTASISSGGKADSMNDVSLDKIKLPVLFVHHKDDQCHVCPSSEVSTLADDMSNAKLKEIKIFSGGETEGRACGSQSYHGFLGIEDDVVKFISDWVKAHL